MVVEALFQDKAYLGDSVYIEHDGYALRLSTNNGNGPDNAITIEPEVFDALMQYIMKHNLLPYAEMVRMFHKT